MDKEEIEKDFSFLKERENVLAVLLFGSQLRGREHERSDIDICVVAPDADPLKLWLEIDREIRPLGKNYDFHVFEDFSLKLKHEVMENYEIIWCKDKSKLQEYFYRFRKIWEDQAKARGVA